MNEFKGRLKSKLKTTKKTKNNILPKFKKNKNQRTKINKIERPTYPV